MLEVVEKQVSNLRLAGRNTDAQKVALDYLAEVVVQWALEPETFGLLQHITKSAIALGAAYEGKRTLEFAGRANSFL